MPKLRVGLVFGGRSVEHEVSLASANSIFKALDPTRYEVQLVAIDHQGRWHLGPVSLPPESALQGDEVNLPAVPSQQGLVSTGNASDPLTTQLDVIFPIVHGRGGEDGSLQGLLELAEIPYVGSGVLGSSLQMDKEVSKRLLHAAGLPVVPWICIRAAELEADPTAACALALDTLGLPLFIKPANLGSSVGIGRATQQDELLPAMRDAARYDTKILVERGLDARDIEVAILGGVPIEASVPGEIRTGRKFYDYEAKYVDEDTELLVPAPLEEDVTQRLRTAAIEAFRVLEGEGLGRVDFLLLRETNEYFINEVNSLPGFTEASMYPKLWEASGLPYPALLDRLIELALERHRARAMLETQYRRT